MSFSTFNVIVRKVDQLLEKFASLHMSVTVIMERKLRFEKHNLQSLHERPQLLSAQDIYWWVLKRRKKIIIKQRRKP